MKYLFIVQGEGRGHMTQAVALNSVLSGAGHEVVSVIVGTSGRRDIPQFFEKGMPCEIKKVSSPNFVADAREQTILIWKTIRFNLKNYKKYLKSLKTISKEVEEKKPDVIVNFYDFLGGLYYFTYRPRVSFICIAHQYLAAHPTFQFPQGRYFERLLFKANNRITSIGAQKKLALSMYPLDRYKEKLIVTPPLLRKEVWELESTKESFLLAYVVNSGYANEIIEWHKRNPTISIHCFWDKKGADDTTFYSPNLVFHKINGTKFLQMMSKCAGYMSTAGFESICEAFYLGKPTLMIPVRGQFEQACNAIDAQKAGAGIWSDFFDIDKLLKFKNTYQSDDVSFQNWVDQGESIYLSELTSFNPIPKYSYRLKKLAAYPLKGLVQTA